MSHVVTNNHEEAFEDQKDLFVPEAQDAPLSITPPDRRLITQPYDFSVRNIVDQINDKTLDTHPSFQRAYVWDDTRASSLIESLIINIPIPVCYFAEEESGKYTVIDGHQRLYSIWRYVNNLLSLQNLDTLPEFNGKQFKELDERVQRLITGRSIRCIVIMQESHPEIRFEVFQRLNSGAMDATDQEIRNAIYRGDFNDLLKQLAQSNLWLQVMGKKKLDRRMRDEELILRFFAVHENYRTYQAPLRGFLNDYAEKMTFKKGPKGERIRVPLSPEDKERLTALFKDTMTKALAVFDGHAFRPYVAGKWERAVNRALFDAVTLVLAALPAEQLVEKKGDIEAALIDLFKDEGFLEAISGSRAHRDNFVRRIKMFSEALSHLGLDTGIHTHFSA